MRSGIAWLTALLLAPCAHAQDLVVFDDAGRNGFDPGYSYGGGTDILHATTVRSGAVSIAFTGNASFNAVAFARPGLPDLTTAQYPTLRFFVHGGTAGGQQLRLYFGRNETTSPAIAQGELDPYIQGGAIVANAWREVTVPLAAFGVTGGFDRIDIQTDAGAQPVLYLDDIVLLAPPAQVDPIFLDGFEGDGAAPAGTLQFTPAMPDQAVAESAGTATFTVTRTGGTNGAVGTTVVLGGTASNPGDYTASALALTWANGDATSRTVTLTLANDVADEPAETVTLALGAPSGGATLGAPASATLTILDDDDAPSAGTLQFMASPDRSVSETAGTVTFNVTRTGGSAGAVSTTVALGGNATNPADYTNGALTLNWANGDSATKTVTLTPVADLVDEPVETVTLTLGAPTGGATLGAPSTATLTIADAELLYVPRYTLSTVRVYRREPGGFMERQNASLPAGTSPNAIAFARDGKLWVVNEGGTLQRYARSQILAGGNVVPEATITVPAPNAGCCLIDLAFFGDFAYVSRTNFGDTHQILKFPISAFATTGSPVPTVFTSAALDVPAGLEFDPQGRLWVSNFGSDPVTPASNTLVRLITGTGAIDRTAINVATANGRNALNRPEGLAFDAQGTLWVGNNGEPTISGYTAAQLEVIGETQPAHQIDVDPALLGLGNMLGGLAFAANGRLWANYQQTSEVLEYAVTPDGQGGYISATGQRLQNVSTLPGFGGLAFWPVPPTLYREGGGAAAAPLAAQRDVSVSGRVSDRYTWIDAAGMPRSAALAHNDTGGGGSMREYTYRVANATRTVGVTDNNFSVGRNGGFGYIVSHLENYDFNTRTIPNCTGQVPVESPLGFGFPGQFARLATGRHHAVHRYTLSYPLYGCANEGGPVTLYPMAVTIDWFFATGRDHPVWAVTLDLSSAPANAVRADSRSPYGELLFDGSATSAQHAQIAGVSWGDGRLFTTTSSPVTYNSAWSWNGANTVPFVKLWTAAPDATMGIVQTQTKAQHDAGGYFGAGRWDTTSAAGPACTPAIGGTTTSMPCNFNWPYQSLNYELDPFGAPNASTNQSRLAWGTNYGAIGRDQYYVHGSAFFGGPNPDAFADGHPKQSYSTFIVLGPHTGDPVGAQVAEVEAVQATAFTAAVGTVRTQGPAGPAREGDDVAYAPAGWDHVYGVWTVDADANAATVNFAVGGGRTLRNPVVGVRNWIGTTLPATVTLDGVPLVQDVDYFPSIVDDADELLITLNRTLAGANNTLAVAQ